jgi:acetylornithine/N-succinyldiaminopimelate aminotransferase
MEPQAPTVSTAPFDSSALMPVTRRPAPLMVRGEGSWLWDAEGRRYLDAVQGWAVNCLGHCPETVQRALAEQGKVLVNASPAYHTAPQLELARELTALAGLDHAFFCTSGAEANEGAIKLARKWGQLHRGGAFEIVTTHGSFHGRTLAMMAASGKPGFDALFPPAVPGFVKVPFGDAAAVAAALGERSVAVMVEPVQGEAGVVVPPAGYLRALRALTEERGVLLVLDEVQTGMGRMGTLLACEHEGVTPDILTLGKGLGGGVPLAALLARKAVSCFAPGDQGGTFAGHPLLTAVGLAVVRELTRPGFLARVQQSGAQLQAGLEALVAAGLAREVRGRGLLWALALPAPTAAAVVDAARARGLLINAPRPDLLRFMPALNVSDDEIDQLLSLLGAALRGP